jgi:hypothetical protein
MVHLTFQALGAQFPFFLPHLSAVTAAFESVVSGTPLLPKSFTLSDDFHGIVPEIRRLLSMFTACWSDPRALEPFLVNTFQLPILIGNIFGFRQFFAIVDHVDVADVRIDQPHPFKEAPSNAFIIEFVKLMLSSSSFIVSCPDASGIANLFPTLTERRGTDLTEGLTFTSTLDVVPLPPEESREIVVSFVGDAPQMALSGRHFGWCPAYLQLWADINGCADRVEKAIAEGGDVEEARLFLNGLIERALRQLFVGVDGEPFTLRVHGAARVDAKL